MKVFSFSLFGDNPIYTIGTIKNVKLINKYFPEWGIFIYTNKNEFDNKPPVANSRRVRFIMTGRRY